MFVRVFAFCMQPVTPGHMDHWLSLRLRGLAKTRWHCGCLNQYFAINVLSTQSVSRLSTARIHHSILSPCSHSRTCANRSRARCNLTCTDLPKLQQIFANCWHI